MSIVNCADCGKQIDLDIDNNFTYSGYYSFVCEECSEKTTYKDFRCPNCKEMKEL